MSSELTQVKSTTNKEKAQRGASLVEYALLVALIAVIALVAIRAVGQRVSAQFSSVSSNL